MRNVVVHGNKRPLKESMDAVGSSAPFRVRNEAMRVQVQVPDSYAKTLSLRRANK
jgi:hypothetical protein